MKVKIKRLDTGLPLPHYETKGSVGFDLLAREDTTIEPGMITLIPGNIIIEVPEGYTLFIISRSSTPRKHGLTKPHGVGVIDQDYCGPEDEIMIQVYNFTLAPVTIERGQKIAQGILVRTDRATFEEVEEMTQTTRGGFGSTDKY